MSYKNCEVCNTQIHHAYRVKITPGKLWVFICETCCVKSKRGEYYIYGGTWKSKEKRLGRK